MPPLVALFIPCYVDQFFPQVGVSTAKLLKHYGLRVKFLDQQVCCGQPMANSGCFKDASYFADSFNHTFKEFEYIVCPSGSCTSMIRNHFKDISQNIHTESASNRTYELCEFLVDVLKISPPLGKFPWKVGIHQACHGLRELRLASSSELVETSLNKIEFLTSNLDKINLIELKRKDECCGFGGTFAIDEAGVSAKMGVDRINDHLNSGAEILTSADMSCLMHLDGIIRRNKENLKILHISELLCEALTNGGVQL